MAKRNDVRPIGGKWWECLGCGRSIAADCECCEPPRCGCSAREKGSPILIEAKVGDGQQFAGVLLPIAIEEP